MIAKVWTGRVSLFIFLGANLSYDYFSQAPEDEDKDEVILSSPTDRQTSIFLMVTDGLRGEEISCLSIGCVHTMKEP